MERVVVEGVDAVVAAAARTAASCSFSCMCPLRLMVLLLSLYNSELYHHTPFFTACQDRTSEEPPVYQAGATGGARGKEPIGNRLFPFSHCHVGVELARRLGSA